MRGWKMLHENSTRKQYMKTIFENITWKKNWRKNLRKCLTQELANLTEN